MCMPVAVTVVSCGEAPFEGVAAADWVAASDASARDSVSALKLDREPLSRSCGGQSGWS